MSSVTFLMPPEYGSKYGEPVYPHLHNVFLLFYFTMGRCCNYVF